MIEQIRLAPIDLKNMVKRTLVIFSLFFIALYLWGKVLSPFIIAFLTAYLIEPLVIKIHHKYKIKRTFIAFVVSAKILILLVLSFMFLVPNLFLEINIIIHKIPNIINYINNDLINYINSNYHTNFAQDLIFIDSNNINYKEFIKSHPHLIQTITLNSVHVFEDIVFLFLYPIILFFTIQNYEILIARFTRIFSIEQKAFLKPIVDDIVLALSKYIRGQSIVLVIMSIYYVSITLLLKGSIFIALISGALLFIPWAGLLTGFLLSIIYSFNNPEFTMVSILIIYGIGYILEHWAVVPYFIGNSLGVHPIVIILSILILAKSFGLIGVILALPLTAVFSVIAKNIYNKYVEYIAEKNFYKNNGGQ